MSAATDRAVCPLSEADAAPSSYYVPELGTPDPGALEWINSVWHLIPETAVFRRYGADGGGSISLREFIRLEREGIRKQERVRKAVVAAVEPATGLRYEPAEVAAGVAGGAS